MFMALGPLLYKNSREIDLCIARVEKTVIRLYKFLMTYLTSLKIKNIYLIGAYFQWFTSHESKVYFQLTTIFY